MSRHFYVLHPENDNTPVVKHSMWPDCFLTVGIALLVVFIVFKGLEAGLIMLAHSGAL